MTSENTQFQLSEETQSHFSKVINSYLQLKDNLVNDNAEQAKTSAQKALEQLQSINSSEEKISAEIQSIKNAFSTISEANKIEKQREEFISLSEEMISISKQIQQPQKLYVQKCPMANNSQGAKWLSKKKEIKNPYYGSSMPGCGSIIFVLE